MTTVPLGLGQSVPDSLEDKINAAGIIFTVITNVMVTIMISTKISFLYRRMRKYVEHETIRPYTNAVAILVESAAPSAVLGVLSSVLMLRQSIKWYLVVFLVWSATIVRIYSSSDYKLHELLIVLAVIILQALSPQLIVLRIATGVAWSSTTAPLYEMFLDGKL
jgi:hypothetical protein